MQDILSFTYDNASGWYKTGVTEDTTGKVPGEIKRSREVELDLQVSPEEIMSMEVEPLDPHVSPEEIMSMEVELGCESWTSFASSCSSTAVQRTLSLSLCPSTAVETAVAQCRD